MYKMIFTAMLLTALLSPSISFADTVDTWHIKLNGKVIVNSNETAIFYGKHPMEVNLSALSDTDSIDIFVFGQTPGVN